MAKKATRTPKPPEVAIKGNDIVPPTDGLLTNPTVTTTFCNLCNIMFSTEGVAYLRWFTKLPGINLEQCRLVVPLQALRSFIDVCCKHLNYYPEKPKT